MKKLLTIIFIIIGFCVLITGVIIFLEIRKDEKKIDNLSENYYNAAYITSCTGGYICFVHDGNEYVSSGKLKDSYTGLADIEAKDGKIKKVYAIKSLSDTKNQTESQSQPDAQNLTESTLPPDTQVKTDSLPQPDTQYETAGHSQSDTQSEEQIQETYVDDNTTSIKVLLKNKSSLYHKDIKVTAKSEIYVNGQSTGKSFTASEFFADGKNKKVTLRSSKEDVKLTFKKKKYEGTITITSTKMGYVIVNELPIETYVKYVIPSEMPLEFSKEALKTQAVCARTFAYMNIKNPAYKQYDANLDDSTSYQVYNSCGAHDSSNQAVDETKGMVITYNGELINCYYFSTSSGNTENMRLWGSETPAYISSVESKDSNSPYYRWTAKINKNSIVNSDYGKLKDIKVTKKSEHGYAIKIKAIFEHGEIVFKDENKIRRFLGGGIDSIILYNGQVRKDLSSIPSSCFEIGECGDKYITLNGAGFGHDIGLSQYGANKLAGEGQNYEMIIRYYYKNVEIKDVTGLY